MSRVLIVDDEEDMLEVCRDILKKIPDVEVVTEKESTKAADQLSKQSFDLLITDLKMPKIGGIDLITTARRQDATLPTLVITAFPDEDSVAASVEQGVFDFLVKPFSPDQLLVAVRRAFEHKRLVNENAFLSRHLERRYGFSDIIGESPPMQRVFGMINKVAETNSDVLIVGESGTGKELIARSIHAHSLQKEARFVPVDCGAIPESLLERELFGHQKGTFTGADASQMGLFEYAQRGTLFLDELCEMPLVLQAKLLRVLQERTFRRLGEQEERRLDIRIVAATNRDIDLEVREGRFREDLFYRINVVRIELPPLRERPGDIPLLVRRFLERYAKELGREIQDIEEDAMEVLIRYSWPGNIRELQNALKRAIVLTKNGTLILDDFSSDIVNQAGLSHSDEKSGAGFFNERSAKVSRFEKEYLDTLLASHNGDVMHAAKTARLPRGTLYRLLKKYDLNPDFYRN